jgi:hypothetical protein
MIIDISPMFVEFFSMGEDTFTVKSQYDNRDNQVINLKNGLQTLSKCSYKRRPPKRRGTKTKMISI